jgi:hypothetical protein
VALCDCGFEAPTGCACGFLDSDTIEWTKVDGQESQREPSPRIDPRSDNILSCGSSGLLAKLPAHFLSRPEFRIYRSTTQSIGNDTPTLVSYNTEQVDTDSMFTATDTEVFINTPGFYLLYSSVRWAVDADGWRDLSLLLNGAVELARDLFFANQAIEFANHVSTIYRLTSTDFLQCRVHHTAGGSLNILAANANTANSRNTFGGIFLGDL